MKQPSRCDWRPVLLWLGVGLATVGLLPTVAQGTIRSYDIVISVHQDGGVIVSETVLKTTRSASSDPEVFHPLANEGSINGENLDWIRAETEGGRSVPVTPTVGGARLELNRADTAQRFSRAYQIQYAPTAAIQVQTDRESLTWHLAAGWAETIERFDLYIYLPTVVPAGGIDVAFGAGADARFRKQVNGRTIHLRAREPLDPTTGAQLEVSWPAGVFERPESRTAPGGEGDKAPPLSHILWLGGVVLFFLYLGLVSALVGLRQRGLGPASRRSPPNGVPPAASRFLLKRHLDCRLIAATLVDLAVRGYLIIIERQDGFLLRRVGYNIAMSPGEQELSSILFRDNANNVFWIHEINREAMNRALHCYGRWLRRSYDPLFYRRRWFPLSVGWAGGIGLLATLAVSLPLGDLVWVVGIALWLLGLFALVRRVTGRRVTEQGRRMHRWLAGLLIPFYGLFGLLALYPATLWEPSTSITRLLWMGVLASGIGWGLRYLDRLLTRPTPYGRQVLAQTQGFRNHLMEVGRPANNREPAEDATKRYEQYLPYAVALNVEQGWTAQYLTAQGQRIDVQAVEQRLNTALDWYQRGEPTQAEHIARLGHDLEFAIREALGDPGAAKIN